MRLGNIGTFYGLRLTPLVLKGYVEPESGKGLTFLILDSQKSRRRLSFERAHDAQTDTYPVHKPRGRSSDFGRHRKIALARASDAGDIMSKPMLIGYARVSTGVT